MGIRTKTMITIILVGIIIGAFSLQSNNSSLFEGRIFNQTQDESENANTQAPPDSKLLPDLEAEFRVVPPSTENNDISVVATIRNNGPGAVKGDTPYEYSISINGALVFTNTDSYTTMEKNDEFSFTYPIPRSIYEYPNTGNIEFHVDSGNSIEEENEDNNKLTKTYTF